MQEPLAVGAAMDNQEYGDAVEALRWETYIYINIYTHLCIIVQCIYIYTHISQFTTYIYIYVYTHIHTNDIDL